MEDMNRTKYKRVSGNLWVFSGHTALPVLHSSSTLELIKYPYARVL